MILPDVVGSRLVDARERLWNLGIDTEIVYEDSETVKEGYVIRQSVDAGKSMQKGGTLILTVSSGTPETDAPTDPPTKPPTDAPTEPPTEDEADDSQFPDTPYLIKVFSGTDVYESASANSPIVLTIDEEGVYTIVEETYDGYGRWGRLKSGAGWICISDVLESGGFYVEG